MKFRKRAPVLLALLALLVCFPASAQEETQSGSVTLYKADIAGGRLETDPYTPEGETTTEIAEELVQYFNRKDAAEETDWFLPGGVVIKSWSVADEDVLELHFSEEYRELPSTQEILIRGETVRTFMQVPGINGISILIEEEPLRDQKGEEVGVMTGDSFVELFTSDRESYRYDTFLLYFTNKKGKKLVPETRRVYYRSSIPKMRVALEQLAKGPIEQGHYPTIPDSTELRNVILSDNICYADFNRAFTEQMLPLDPELVLYSVVDTLIANTGAEKVQISIAGSEEEVLGEDTELFNFYQWNEEIIKQEE